MKKIFAVLLMLVMVFSLAACGGSTEKNHDGEAETPSGSKIQQGRGYQEVVSDFEESGFTNIQLAPMGDLITGWLTKEGEVESVSVGGDEEYSPNKWVPADTEVIIRYHSFPEVDTGSDSSDAEESQSADTVDTGDDILTVENCEALASMITVKAEIDDSYKAFAENYKGQTILFDSCITYVMNHDDYKTRYDILLSAGDYVDENTANPGPFFKFEDVNTNGLGIEDLYLPSFVAAGSNVRVTAKVDSFDAERGIFYLKPVLVEER